MPEAEFVRPTLVHTDLHVGNIFVYSAENPEILAIIDWQAVEFQPLYLAARFPRLIDCDTNEEGPIPLTLPEYPRDYGEMDGDQKKIVKAELEAKLVKRYWLLKTLTKNKPLGRVFSRIPYRHLRLSLYYNSTNSWGEDIALLRRDLIEVINLWHYFDDGSCPVSFSENELRKDRRELKAYNSMIESISILMTTLGVGKDGWVSNERYIAVKAANEEWKRDTSKSMSLGKPQHQEWWGKWWPFSDQDE